MRISDNRYDRDRARFDLALRMMGHQARNQTIKTWTGLSEDRVRKLYKAYCFQPATSAPRHRGRSPRQPVYFLQTATLCFEATTLASLLHAAGFVHLGSLGARTLGAATLERGQAFCDTYDAYLKLCPMARFSFEHAYFLLICLTTREHMELNRCGQCGRLYLSEAGRLQPPSCGCGRRQLGWPRRGRLPKRIIQAYDGWAHSISRGRRAVAAVQSG